MRLTRCEESSDSRAVSVDSAEVLRRVESQLDLVEIAARQLRRQLGASVELDDLRSAAREGLLHAARGFDPSLAVPFRRWANLRIKGAMIDYVRQQTGLPRSVYRRIRALHAAENVYSAQIEEAVPSTPEGADSKLDEWLAQSATAMAMAFLKKSATNDGDLQSSDPDPEQQVERAELRAMLQQTLAAQPEAERTLLQRHYFDELTFEDTANELGLSRSWACRLHARALDNLARALKERVR